MNIINRGTFKNITIKELSDLKDSSPVMVVGIVSGVTIKQKTNGENYLLLSIVDKTGMLESPIWNDYKRYEDDLKPGKIIVIDGSKKTFDNKPQINVSVISEAKGFADSEFVEAYEVTSDMLKEFVEICKLITDKRYIEMLEYILGISITKAEITDREKWNKFLDTPSAIRHHGNKKHGLFVHTLGVMKAMKSIVELYPASNIIDATEVLDKDLLLFMSAIHDYCKIYEYSMNPMISYNESLYVNHEVLMIAELGIANSTLEEKFSQEELSKMYFMLLTHHGQWSKYQPVSKDKIPTESRLLHIADMIDSQIVGEVESK